MEPNNALKLAEQKFIQSGDAYLAAQAAYKDKWVAHSRAKKELPVKLYMGKGSQAQREISDTRDALAKAEEEYINAEKEHTKNTAILRQLQSQ